MKIPGLDQAFIVARVAPELRPQAPTRAVGPSSSWLPAPDRYLAAWERVLGRERGNRLPAGSTASGAPSSIVAVLSQTLDLPPDERVVLPYEVRSAPPHAAAPDFDFFPKLDAKETAQAWRVCVQNLADLTLPGGFFNIAYTQEQAYASDLIRWTLGLHRSREMLALQRMMTTPLHRLEARRAPNGMVVVAESQGDWPDGVSPPNKDVARPILAKRIVVHDPRAEPDQLIEWLARSEPVDKILAIERAGMTFHLGKPPPWEPIPHDPCLDVMTWAAEAPLEGAQGGQYFQTRQEAWVWNLDAPIALQAEIAGHESDHFLERVLGENGMPLSSSPRWLAIHGETASFVCGNSSINESEHLVDALNVQVRPIANTVDGAAVRTRVDLAEMDPEAAHFSHEVLAKRLPEVRQGRFQRAPTVAEAAREPLANALRVPLELRESGHWFNIALGQLYVAAIEHSLDEVNNGTNALAIAAALTPLSRMADIAKLNDLFGDLRRFLENGTLPEAPISLTLQRWMNAYSQSLVERL